jgi:pimeloyl-ACP methyl ester carboxylesterase
MTNPTRVVAVLIAASLSVCVFGGRFDPATGQIATTEAQAVANPAAKPRGRAYLFRGFAGMVFSRGTDKLADKIKQFGFTATVNEAMMCPNIIKEAIQDYRRDPAPIYLIGHSVGGACALSFAESLRDEQIPVRLLVTTEPARISHDVPPNVERYINIYQSDSVLGGIDVAPAPGFQGHYATFDLAEHKEISHVNMEKSEVLHDQVLTKMLQPATLAKAETDVMPLHYVVPADAAIELWDSGMPVLARPGDTLQTLAAFYRVPLWSLSQINQVPDDALLVPGQRVIVPRHLGSPAPTPPTAAAKAPSRR